MEINAQAPQATQLSPPQSLANKPENANNQNASNQDLQSPPSSDTVDISPAAARLAAPGNDVSRNSISNSAQARQATEAIQQSDSNELLRVQGNPPSNQVLASLLS